MKKALIFTGMISVLLPLIAYISAGIVYGATLLVVWVFPAFEPWYVDFFGSQITMWQSFKINLMWILFVSVLKVIGKALKGGE